MPPKADAHAAAAAPAAAGGKQRRKPERIVPAIPFALQRTRPSAMPITPDETAAEKVTQEHGGGLPPAVDQTPASPPIEEPFTPQSNASDGNDALAEPSSPGLAEPLPDTAAGTAMASVPEPSPGLTLADHAASTHPVDGLEEALHRHLDELSVEARDAPPAQQSSSLEPSEQSPSHPQASAGADAPFSPVAANTASHKARPSLDGIVVGARHDSPAIPSPPYEPAPVVPPAQAPHNTLPGFGGHQFAAPFHPGHAQHPSDHHAPWPAPALPMNPLQPPPNAPYQNHFHGQSSPQNSVTLANGASTSHSQSPGRSQFGGQSFITRDLQFMTASGDNFVNGQATVDWLMSHFGNPEHADCVLRVRSGTALLLNLPAIRVMVTRSPTIAAAIRNRGPLVPQADGSPPVIDIFTLDRFVTQASVVEAAKVLYGAPLLPLDLFLNGLGPFRPDGEHSPTLNDARNRMSQAISYAAAMRLFGLGLMYGHGIQMIKTLMRWDTIDLAISFGLSMDFQSAGQQSMHPRDGVPVSPDEYYAAAVLYADCVEFIASDFPFHFRLHTIAPELKDNPRLPHAIEQPAHNPRLSRIRFGDVPPEDELKPNYITRTLSSILLTLPLPMVDDILNNIHVVENIGASEVERTMRDVVAERERRREKVLKTRGFLEAGLPQTLVNNMFYEELIVQSKSQRSGFSLSEKRISEHV